MFIFVPGYALNPSFVMTKLVDIILLSLAVVFIVIGAYEVMTVGLGHAYWSVMLALLFFFIYMIRKKKTG